MNEYNKDTSNIAPKSLNQQVAACYITVGASRKILRI